MSNELAPRRAVILFAIVVLAWGTNWPVTKLIVQSIPPLWATALRCWIALLVLLPILWGSGNLIVPRRGDMPVVFGVAFLHMIAFSTLVATGLQFVPASKAIVLGYTTPLWVAVCAPAMLGETVTKQRIAGVLLGLAGLAVILSPHSLDWTDGRTMFGSGLVMLAAACWAANIIYVRMHRWMATPFQLLIWQVFVAAVVLSAAALMTEGYPSVTWSPRVPLLLLYGGIVGTALAYWAMSVVNRSLPAITTSLGILATPVAGIASAALALGEAIDLSLLLATGLIMGGIAIGTLPRGPKR
jgi:drug/metabolite transporter (DMT)-like permease